jgi:hypothetical protein
MNYEKEIKEYLDTQDMTINTKKGYISGFNSLQKLFNTTNIDYIKTPDTTIKKIEEAYPKENVMSTKINTILLLFKIFYLDDKEYEKYKKKFLKYRKTIIASIKEDYAKHEATEKQKEKAITEEQNEKIMQVLKDRIKHATKSSMDIINIRNYIIYSFINILHTRGDFITSKLVKFKPKFEYDPEYNYIVIYKDKTIKYVQNNYKTKDTYGQKTHLITGDLYKWFLKLYNAYRKLELDTDYAFYQDNMITPMNPKNLSYLYSKIGLDVTGHKISLQVARVQNASEDYDIFEAVREKAEKQGHSMDTHYMYAKKDIIKK